ncbi:orotate phosphoribosyltransferase [Eremococcus coleocola]|uniref:orotate phosphoribosyltransferase n=1 Tax=Eremococcus coleocola TaxID=88132 RepID=UPI00041E6B53|nr:orotate phosphoribosyltransferase [Eremococcus coleocola]
MLSPQEIAQILLDRQAVSLSPDQPYTWTSGLKAPIYCDNRLLIGYPQERNQIVESFIQLIQTHYPDADVIAGTATAGIPHAAIIAHQLNLPMIYVRASAKGHGKQNTIEGPLKPGQKVVMIEDLISTGGSVIAAADVVQAAGGKVLGCLAIFDYQLDSSKTAFTQAGYDYHTLSNYLALVDQATQNPDLAHAKATLTAWHQDPLAWTKVHS